MIVGLLVGEDTWSLVIRLCKMEEGLEVKLGKGSLEESSKDWQVIEVVGGERIGMEAIRGGYE